MVGGNHWDQWFSDGFGVRQPLETMVFDGCAPLVRRWNGMYHSWSLHMNSKLFSNSQYFTGTLVTENWIVFLAQAYWFWMIIISFVKGIDYGDKNTHWFWGDKGKILQGEEHSTLWPLLCWRNRNYVKEVAMPYRRQIQWWVNLSPFEINGDQWRSMYQIDIKLIIPKITNWKYWVPICTDNRHV